MLDFERRVAKLEGRVEGQVRVLTDVGAAVRHLEVRMDRRFADVDVRFTVLEGRLTALDQKFDRKTDELSTRVDALAVKLDGHFRWIVGIQFGMLATMIAALVAG